MKSLQAFICYVVHQECPNIFLEEPKTNLKKLEKLNFKLDTQA